MISIRGLSKEYPSGGGKVIALRDINLHIKKGEIAGIIGFSGAGKSTLVRCINLLERPTTGVVTVDGEEITSLKGRELRNARQKIGMIFQHFNLLTSRTVSDNVAYPLEVAGWPKDKIRQRVEELLQLVGLTERAQAYPAQLSGGQKQRVGIARALANGPKVLLCDEATSALDPSTTKSILTLLRDINVRLGLTIVVITHEMQVIKEICDTVSVIEQGAIIESGPVLGVFADPREETTRGFLNNLHNLEIPRDFYRVIASDEEYHQLLRVVFTGPAAAEPIISSLPKDFGVRVNVLAGNIDYIRDTPLGILSLDIAGTKDKVQQSVDYLKSRKLKVEVQELGC